MKGPDLSCIPLCHQHHIGELHQYGPHYFEEKHNVNLWRLNQNALRQYIEKVEK